MSLLTTHSLVPGPLGSLLMVDLPIPTCSSERLHWRPQAGWSLGLFSPPTDPYSSLEDLSWQTDLGQESPAGLVGPGHLIRVSQV